MRRQTYIKGLGQDMKSRAGEAVSMRDRKWSIKYILTKINCHKLIEGKEESQFTEAEIHASAPDRQARQPGGSEPSCTVTHSCSPGLSPLRVVGEPYLLQRGARGHTAKLLPQLLKLLHGDFGGRGRGTEGGGAAAYSAGCKLGAFFRVLL